MTNNHETNSDEGARQAGDGQIAAMWITLAITLFIVFMF